jgi:hypothetical protein
MTKSIKFVSKVGEKEIDFLIKPESLEIQRRCDSEYSIAYVQAIQAGVPPRSVLERVLRDQDMWTKADDERMEQLRFAIVNLETQIAEAKTTDEGLPLAVKLGELRGELVEITQLRGEVLNNSAEFMAEQVRRDAYIAHATVYADTGKRVFEGYADFVKRSEESVSLDARQAIARALYEELGGYLDSLPEAAFRNAEVATIPVKPKKKVTKKKVVRKKR